MFALRVRLRTSITNGISGGRIPSCARSRTFLLDSSPHERPHRSNVRFQVFQYAPYCYPDAPGPTEHTETRTTSFTSAALSLPACEPSPPAGSARTFSPAPVAPVFLAPSASLVPPAPLPSSASCAIAFSCAPGPWPCESAPPPPPPPRAWQAKGMRRASKRSASRPPMIQPKRLLRPERSSPVILQQ